MASDWREYSFAELLSNIVDNRGKTCPTAESGLPLIATNCVKNENFYPSFDKIRYVSQETYESWFRGHPKPNDLIFVCKGSPGNVCWTPDPVNFCIAQDMVAIRANEEIIDPKFLFALLRSKSTQNKIVNMHVGTMIPHFKKGDFKNLFFEIPADIDFQKNVGEIYFNFCEKIELNRQMNQTLENMAQALFKSWFVDFDPVIDNALAAGNPIPDALKAKATQRTEQLEAATQIGTPTAPNRELFPSEFTFTEELGWIPKGWHVLGFEDLAEAKQGKYLSSDKMKSFKDDEYAYPVWGGNEIRGYSKKFTFEEPSVILTCRGSNCGLIKITDNESWVTNSSFACLPKVGSAYFVYLYFLNENFSSVVSGSAQPQITYRALKNKIMKYPISNQVVENFSEQVYLLRKKAILNTYKIKSLSSLRDTLLSKLLSGELRVSEAAGMVEGV